MQLDTFIREKSLTDESFALLLGEDVSEWAVRKWRYGQRIPRPTMQQRIAVATGGQVTPNDFLAAVVASGRRREEAAAKRTLTSGAAA
jgi:DNA-binding transcriptional regulator YdaS (Cro superfamily)